MDTLKCVAHRGGANGDFKKENSLAAIEQSLALGVSAFEIDVWLVDDELMVFHDRRLSRFTDSNKKLEECNRQELENLGQSHGFEIPTLLEVVQLINGRALLNIELKGPNCITAVGNLINKRVHDGLNHWRDFIVSSFDQPQLLLAKALFPKLQRGLLICGVPADLAQQASNLQCKFLGLSLDFVRPELVADCHQRGINAWVYTVNHPEDFHWLASIGVDAVFTDYPERLLAWQKKN